MSFFLIIAKLLQIDVFICMYMYSQIGNCIRQCHSKGKISGGHASAGGASC